MSEKEKLELMADQLVENIGLAVVDVQNGNTDMIGFINEINKNMESFGEKIVEISNKLKEK